jgi:glucan phosphoethanolaminetransferase (alkaline phosphatase superfamily)
LRAPCDGRGDTGVASFIAIFNTAFGQRCCRRRCATSNAAILLSSFAILLRRPSCYPRRRRAVQPWRVAPLIVAAVTGFFMSEYRVVIDPSMIRSVAETQLRRRRRCSRARSSSTFFDCAALVAAVGLRGARLTHEQPRARWWPRWPLSR